MRFTPPDVKVSPKWLFSLVIFMFVSSALFLRFEVAEVNATISTGSVTLKDKTNTIATVLRNATASSPPPHSSKQSGFLVSLMLGMRAPTSQPTLSPTNTPTFAPTPTPAPSAEIKDVRLDIHAMKQEFLKKRDELYENLRKDYGSEFFQRVFLQHGRSAFKSNSKSQRSGDRMRRKMMIKLLQAQDAVKQPESSNLRAPNPTVTPASWSNNTARDSRRLKAADLASFPTYVWATGGHSAAAGHGNLHEQSYTAVLERAAKDVFAAVGLNFVGRNHAMGGTSIGPEIAMCAEAIFGNDVDVLAWDTGMTDGQKTYKMEQYFLRAATQLNQPAFVALNTGGTRGRGKVVREMEEKATCAFELSEGTIADIKKAIPDTAGKSDQEIAEMPELVRKFKCGKQLELGDPGCKKAKFTGVCGGRKGKNSWHPGWKWHALYGNLMAVWLMNVLEDALGELANQASDASFPDKIRSDERAEYDTFMKVDLPKTVRDMEIPNDIDRNLFFRGSNICHTARLPAQSRHLGILTESSMIGEDSYEKGVEEGHARHHPPEDGSMALVYAANERETCPVPIKKDYKDFFYVGHGHGWRQLTVPNDSEVKAYGTGEPLRGVIAICFAICNWNKCPKGNLRAEHFHEMKASMRVNNVTVRQMTTIDNCSFLKNADGHIWKPNKDGRFEISAKVHESKSYTRISSFVVW